ncbi:MAG: hypothetical protein GY852_04550, partial [bacterium]|nr:hypothetical protein [bacterium]
MQFLGVFGRSIASQPDGATRKEKGKMAVSDSIMKSEEKSLRAPAPMLLAKTESSKQMPVDSMRKDTGAVVNGEEGGESPEQYAGTTVRTNFADTAYWNGSIKTDKHGKAEIELTMPENLTKWKIRTWGLGRGPRVGESTVEVVTTKNLLLRLQAPRFFVEKDEVVLSAN